MATDVQERSDHRHGAQAPEPPVLITRRRRATRQIKRGWQLYAMLAVPMLLLVVYSYWPMYGIQIAFKNFNALDGITGSPWVGLKHFERFIDSYLFWPIVKNTVILYVYELAATFPLPIVLALGLNYMRLRWFKRTVQMVTYAPHFISTVMVVGIVFVLANPTTGLLNSVLGGLGLDAVDLTGDPAWFRHVYVWSGVWQTTGFSAIVYLAALTSIDPNLHESAVLDGASTWRRTWHIDLPGIAPVTVILFVLQMAFTLYAGFERVLLLQNPLNLEVSEVIDTYVYKVGLASQIPQFSYATAIGLFKSVIALILLLIANRIARRLTGWSLW